MRFDLYNNRLAYLEYGYVACGDVISNAAVVNSIPVVGTVVSFSGGFPPDDLFSGTINFTSPTTASGTLSTKPPCAETVIQTFEITKVPE